MVNLNWKGKNECISDLSSLKHQTFNSLKVLELIKWPINEKIEKYPEGSRSIVKNVDEEQENKSDWVNLLIWGENKSIMRVLQENFTNKINLIYLDPPFGTGGSPDYKIQVGEGDLSKDSTKWIRKKAYSDAWREGMDSYLTFMYERLRLMHELLAENGSIYVHLDWRMSHYLKIVMDEIFGEKNFRNEIIWSYPSASVQTKKFFVRSFETILFYTKFDDYIFNDDSNIYMEYSDRVKKALKKDEKGLYYHRGGSHDGKKLSQKVYIEKTGVFPRDTWTDIPYIRANTGEYQGFSTQKPERLLKRIILASTNENDLVADFFCGSGTTLIVAEKLRRRWIGCDSTKHAIHITRKRLLDIYNSNDLFNWNNIYEKKIRPFKILSLDLPEKKQTTSNELFEKEEKDHKSLNNGKNPDFKVNFVIEKKGLVIELKDYIIPSDFLNSEEIKATLSSFSDWIDYWAIDFDYKGGFFNNAWVYYRTPKERDLKLQAGPFSLDKSKDYEILIKVIDIFGNETSKLFNIEM